ncbi:hypothetical protein ACERK3_16370 [Phycisphaerales bacterium AB-hyl4]|uniref:ResB-like domain-containing protein n=1 Tax=Natronomicrosphaera hydrolytica TaxID=3242702 RepID=A0ABV4UB42_9BACT
MSAKYERIKQADLSLPAPLRWLTRAFSSITLSVILLSLVCLYGIAATIPVLYLALTGAYTVIGLITVGLAAVAGFVLLRRVTALPWYVRVAGCLAMLAFGGVVGVRLGYLAYEQLNSVPWLLEHRATVIYRLPWLEMTELEFYAWWPMQIILILFVLNMVWATIRRIEFKFANLGVLTVHSGIVVMAIGSILYGHFKVEGDTILWRRDLGGTFENVFYDAHEPALYIDVDDRQLMVPIPELPRYNDYPVGSLDIHLHRFPQVREMLGENVRLTIPGFKPYADLEPVWRPLRTPDDHAAALATSPALRIALGDDDGPADEMHLTLASNMPAERLMERQGYTVEYLLRPSRERIEDLSTSIAGEHGLIIEIPEHGYREAHAIEPGQTINLDELGYRFTIRDVGEYGMPFVTAGYEDATDTQATIEVTTPDGEQFTRMSLYRYPERTQDFVPSDDPAAGPMGERRDPDPSIRLVYLDSSRWQYHLVADRADADVVGLALRMPGGESTFTALPEQRIRVPGRSEGLGWLYIEQIIPLAGRMTEPRPTPRDRRDASEEGTYINSLLPVRVEVDQPDEQGGTWSRLVWMRHMRYPKYPDQVHRPVFVDLPEVGQVRLAFSRRRFELPFAIALDHFEMQPYPGSQIPQDFTAELLISDVDEHGLMHNQPDRHIVHMNHPLNYRATSSAPLALQRIKISQTGWDPPDSQNPAAAEERDEQGRFLNQQRFTILGIGNNVGIRIIALGATMVGVGIPWAFYIKPWLTRREMRRLQREFAEQAQQRPQHPDVDTDDNAITPTEPHPRTPEHSAV